MTFYPPRASTKILSSSLPQWEAKGWVAEPKLNGSNCLIIVSDSGYLDYNRHKERFTKRVDIPIMDLYMGKNMVLNGEWLNKNKAPINEQFCIFDILSFDNKPLIGSTWSDRQQLLDSLFPIQETISNNTIDNIAPEIYGNIRRVRPFKSNFLPIYQEITKLDVIEGFVLKRPNSILSPLVGQTNNANWMVKCRKPSNSYRA